MDPLRRAENRTAGRKFAGCLVGGRVWEIQDLLEGASRRRSRAGGPVWCEGTRGRVDRRAPAPARSGAATPGDLNRGESSPATFGVGLWRRLATVRS